MELASLLDTACTWRLKLQSSLTGSSTYSEAPPDRPPVRFSSQIFGAGKSTFGARVPVLLRQLLEKGSDSFMTACAAKRLSMDDVRKFANAATVVVNISELALTPEFARGVGNSNYFRDRVLHAAGLENAELRERFATKFRGSSFVDALLYVVQRRDGVQYSSVYVFFDEISAIETVEAQNLQLPVGQQLSLDQARVAYRALGGCLHSLISDTRVFSFIAGKSSLLTEVALAEKRDGRNVSVFSRISLTYLPLSCFSYDHIVELMTQWKVPGTGRSVYQVLSDELGLSDEKTFVNRLLVYTGGVPRMVCMALRGLLDLRSTGCAVLSTTASIDAVLEGPVFAYVKNSEPMQLRPDLTPPHARALFFYLALSSEPITTDQIEPFTYKPYTDWLSMFGFSLRARPTDGKYDIVLPRYVLLNMIEERDSASAALRVLCRLEPAAVSRSRVLELFVAGSLAHRLERGDVRLSNVFTGAPGLARHPVLSKVTVPRCNGGVALSGGENAEQNKDAIVKLLGDDHINDFLPLNCVTLMRSEKAHFADVVLRFEVASGSDSEHFLGIACKNYQGAVGVTFEEIVEEMEKFFVPLKVSAVICVFLSSICVSMT